MLLVVIGKQNVWQVCILMLETKNAAFILEEKWSAKYGGNQNLIQILVSKTLHSANIRISRYWLFFDDVAYYSPGALK